MKAFDIKRRRLQLFNSTVYHLLTLSQVYREGGRVVETDTCGGLCQFDMCVTDRQEHEAFVQVPVHVRWYCVVGRDGTQHVCKTLDRKETVLETMNTGSTPSRQCALPLVNFG